MVSRMLGMQEFHHGRIVNSLECYTKLKRIRAERKLSDWSINRYLVIFTIAVSVAQQRKKLGFRGRKSDCKMRN